MPSTFDEVRPGQSVFIDANIFIYHFADRSPACSSLLGRCERHEVRGVTGAHVVLEVLHRLMMLEAVQKRLVAPGNVVRRLKERPQGVRELNEYARHARRIPDMGIEVWPVDIEVVRASHEVRTRMGLLIHDSITATMMERQATRVLATQDKDFSRVPGIQVLVANDL